MDINLKAIGYIKSPYKSKEEIPRQSIYSDQTGEIKILEEYRDAMYNLEIGKYIVILFVFNESSKDFPLIIDNKYTNGKKGIFATRSPYRPNPIGMSICKIIDIKEDSIIFDQVDMLDNSPVLDIKPYAESLNPKL